MSDRECWRRPNLARITEGDHGLQEVHNHKAVSVLLLYAICVDRMQLAASAPAAGAPYHRVVFLWAMQGRTALRWGR